MKKLITIVYDPATANDGEPLDVFSYLRNELDNAHITASIDECDMVDVEGEGLPKANFAALHPAGCRCMSCRYVGL